MGPRFPPGDPTLISRSLQFGERDGVPVSIATMVRGYDTSVEDLWDALTTPERLARWFLPVTGDLREGGHYQFEGNAGGTITRCVDHARIEATWEFQGGGGWIEVALDANPDGTATLSLTHIGPMDPDFWARYGPGATGIGWDLGLDGFARYVPEPDAAFDADAYAASEAGHAFIATSSQAWCEASIAAGTPADRARAAAANCIAFYTGTPEPGS